MDGSARDSSSVQVALRIRPQNNREKLEGSRICTAVVPNEPQVTIGTDRSFTYDFVFDIPTRQESIYDSCIQKLVDGLFDGYNATVLAYGQTGSGKTFTMGTAFDSHVLREDDIGVIPRAISHVFRQIVACKTKAVENELPEPTFEVGVQFVELYNEEVIDLLCDERSTTNNIRIHENAQGEIYLHGVAIRAVEDLHSTVEILKNGALNRTVASTNMNEQSSRSHAIFTMIVKQQRIVPVTPIEGEPTGETEVESLTAKFHFVDLAGSERLKRTGATGNRAKEGISINSGLLALGNVISALGGASGRVGHVPYRDSKLTRLLQDSLGGNSRTLMIACVSPSDCDFVETLNTLNYANRAKNIKNKVVANQDKSSKVIGELRSKIAALEMELLEFKQGRRRVTEDGLEVANDQYHENIYLTEELNRLRFRIKTLQETIEILQNRNVELIARADGVAPSEGAVDGEDGVQGVICKYITEIETLRSSLFESQATNDQLRKEMQRWKLIAQESGNSIRATAFGAESSPFSPNSFSQKQLIEEARADLERMKKSMIAEGGGSTSDYASQANTDDGDDGTSNDTDDIDLDEDEEEEDESSFGGETKEVAAIRDDLNALQDDINIKERLISELEKSERRLKEVRMVYEKKLSELSLRIQATEAERDRVLAEKLSKKGDSASQEQAKRIKEEYERKLADMKNEYRKLQAVEKEHKKMQARYNREQEQKMKLMADLTDMKRQKVDLVKKLKEEAKKMQQQQQSNQKRLMALDKEKRLRENKIRQLENKDRQRELYMKRTTDEIQRLRQKQREQERMNRQTPNTRNVASRLTRVPVGKNGGVPPQIAFSPKLAKIKWGVIEKKMMAMINRKQTTNKMEDELTRLVQERHRITDEIVALDAKFVASTDVEEREDLSEQREAYNQKKTYIQDQITEVQGQIVALDENKNELDDVVENASDIEALLDTVDNVVEAKYLLQHLYNHSLENGVLAANLRANKMELEARIQQLEHQSFMNEQLLSTVIEGKDKDLANDLENVLENGLRKKNRSPSGQSLRNDNHSPTGTEFSESGHLKIRRRTSNVEELLYPMPESERPPVTPPSTETTTDEDSSRREKKKFDPLPSSVSATHPPSFQRGVRGRNTISSLPSTSRSSSANGLPPRPGLTRMKSTGKLPSVSEEPPRSRRDRTPDGRSQQKSVFARLIPAWSGEASPSTLINRKQGRFVPAKVNGATRVVTRTYTAEGHSKSVMAVAATNDLLLSGSKDRTAKLWNLETGQELRTLGVHPNTVHCVRFVPNSSLALSVSMYQVRVWDIRSQQCLRVLQSSGQVIEGDGGPVGSRQNTMPFLETMINAAEVDSEGRFLFTSFAGDVRIWDIGRWASFGRLVGASHSPKSEVSCLSVTNNDDGVPFVFTGSRDHYVKMYEINSGGAGVYEPLVEFKPPHYDNVTCTLAFDGHLYTSGKDSNIMKFLLKDYKRDHLELKAHNSYVQGMALTRFNDGRRLLTSVCKAGTVKFWDVSMSRRLKLVEEIAAHQEAINDVCTNDYLLFTASSDQTVGVWSINQTAN